MALISNLFNCNISAAALAISFPGMIIPCIGVELLNFGYLNASSWKVSTRVVSVFLGTDAHQVSVEQDRLQSAGDSCSARLMALESGCPSPRSGTDGFGHQQIVLYLDVGVCACRSMRHPNSDACSTPECEARSQERSFDRRHV